MKKGSRIAKTLKSRNVGHSMRGAEAKIVKVYGRKMYMFVKLDPINDNKKRKMLMKAYKEYIKSPGNLFVEWMYSFWSPRNMPLTKRR